MSLSIFRPVIKLKTTGVTRSSICCTVTRTRMWAGSGPDSRGSFANGNTMTAAADRAFGGGTRDMILVMPNAYTMYQGSMFSNSITTGDWEGFIAKDLVA